MEFYKDPYRKSGFDCYCKVCRGQVNIASRHRRADTVKPYDRMRRRERYQRNKDYERERNKKWINSHPEVRREYGKRAYFRKKLKRYNISANEYQDMIDLQDGRCAICGKKIFGSDRHVDHCHKTNKARGILCPKCNRGIGHFDDDPDLLAIAIAYLKGFQFAY